MIELPPEGEPLRVRVPFVYEERIQKLGCTWSETCWAWTVPTSAREGVQYLLEDIEKDRNCYEVL